MLTFRSLGAFALCVSAAVFAQPLAKRPLHHRDYDAWRAIQGQVLSQDGKFLAYSMFPEEGDGEIVVRNLAIGQDVRENAGAPPPAPETQGGEPPTEDAAPAARGVRLAFTARQFQYEKTQSRIGGTLWEDPLRFIENSPVFQIDRIKTPS